YTRTRSRGYRVPGTTLSPSPSPSTWRGIRPRRSVSACRGQACPWACRSLLRATGTIWRSRRGAPSSAGARGLRAGRSPGDPLPLGRGASGSVESRRMTDSELEEKIKAMTFWSGKNSMSIEDMAAIQPGLARIMPEIGARTWKLYYAAKHENWPMAKFQYKEIVGLFETGAFMRPKHEAAINQYLAENWKPRDEPLSH